MSTIPMWDAIGCGSAITTRQFYIRSSTDLATKMFWDCDRLYCETIGHRANLIRLLWEEGLLEELGKLGLLAEVEPVAGADCAFTLGLRQYFRLSYCYEWCPEMWKAGALHILDLLSVLADFELTLQSPGPDNLLFVGPRPVYINPGSVAHLTSFTFHRAVNTLLESFLYPVILSLAGKSHLTRKLLQGITHGISAGDFTEVEVVAKEVTAWVETLSPADCLRKLKSEVEAIRITDAESRWSNYYVADAPLTPGEGWSHKQREVYRILTDLRPPSVLDLASNIGWYSRLASTVTTDVTAADFDETCVNQLYRRVRAERGGVLPLLMDVNDPSPGFGVGNSWLPPASARFRSDLVLALAVSHHLVFSGMRLTLDELVCAFAPFAKRWLLVEFIPFCSQGMIYAVDDHPECASWYNLESFVAALATQFSTVTVLPGAQLSRRLVLCER